MIYCQLSILGPGVFIECYSGEGGAFEWTARFERVFENKRSNRLESIQKERHIVNCLYCAAHQLSFIQDSFIGHPLTDGMQKSERGKRGLSCVANTNSLSHGYYWTDSPPEFHFRRDFLIVPRNINLFNQKESIAKSFVSNAGHR